MAALTGLAGLRSRGVTLAAALALVSTPTAAAPVVSPKVVGNVDYLPKSTREVTVRGLDGSNPKPFPAGKWATTFDWR